MKDAEVWKYYPTNCTDSETNHGPDIYDMNLTCTSEHRASMLVNHSTVMVHYKCHRIKKQISL